MGYGQNKTSYWYSFKGFVKKETISHHILLEESMDKPKLDWYTETVTPQMKIGKHEPHPWVRSYAEDGDVFLMVSENVEDENDIKIFLENGRPDLVLKNPAKKWHGSAQLCNEYRQSIGYWYGYYASLEEAQVAMEKKAAKRKTSDVMPRKQVS